MGTQGSVTDTVVFLLGKLGRLANDRFAERLAGLGLRPRHCAVLEILAEEPLSQLVIARAIGVAPSVVVDMMDELEDLGAVRRVRDERDRRRQLVELTDTGRTLGELTVGLAEEVGAELLAPLGKAARGRLREDLADLGAAQGIRGGA